MSAREANRNLLTEIIILGLYLLSLVFVIAGFMTSGLMLQLSYGTDGGVSSRDFHFVFFILSLSWSPTMVVPWIGLGIKWIFVTKEDE